MALRQHYRVSMPEPWTHRFQVHWHLEGVAAPLLVKMPVWTPGSYLVREYARHLQNLRVTQNGIPGQVEHESKNTWMISAAHYPCDLDVFYEIYAGELTVRTNHLDLSHGYFNGAALFLYTPQDRQSSLTVTIVPPDPTWAIATALPIRSQQEDSTTFVAASYDQLVDSPVEVGIHKRLDFQVLGKPHTWVFWGEGDLDPATVQADTVKIVETASTLFGGLPYENYLFLVHWLPDGFGGLEHRNSTSLIFNGFGQGDPEHYQRFLALVAHEFFHTWNVKRLRPKALETIDYDQETYLTCLWFVEGATSYFENWLLQRAGLLTPPQWLTLLGKQITRLQLTPGRLVQSLRESSWDTWIKLYRPHENTLNSQVSYYLKGALVCWLLDLHLLERSQGHSSLAMVFQDLWQRFGQKDVGYSDQDLREACERAAQGSLDDFWRDYIDGTRELDYNRFLEPFGLQVVANGDPGPPYLGLRCQGSLEITAVEEGSPAQRAGLWAGDELVAINGYKVTSTTWTEHLRRYRPGDTIPITVFQRQQLKTVAVTLADPRPDHYVIQPLATVSAQQAQRYRQWMALPESP
ncbi:MAG: PDZ domain-containing protein [Synechococcales cyanobacterium]